MESQHPRIIFGGSTIGEAYTTPESVTALLATLQEQGISQIDTAALYPFINMGMSETLLGEAAATVSCAVDTKILVTSKDTAGTMAADKIEASITSSKQRLKAKQLNILYCHAPDTATAAVEQLATLDAHYKAGDFKQLGVCNFTQKQLSDWLALCDEKGYVRPTVYQGLYNVVSRHNEAMIPFLKDKNIQFIAHSPVASGFLSGKFTSGSFDDTRFGGSSVTANALRGQWDKENLHEAMRELNSQLEPTGISSIEAALRWVCFHSALGPQDAVILGASKPAYIEQNIAWIKRGPLPANLVDALNKLVRTGTGDKAV